MLTFSVVVGVTVRKVIAVEKYGFHRLQEPSQGQSMVTVNSFTHTAPSVHATQLPKLWYGFC